MKQLFLRKGFTLIEVLVGLVIISIISVASYTTVSILTRSSEVSRNRIIASNFMQKSMEEVRRVAQTNFDDLENCAFPAGAATTGDACGFEPTSTTFPGFLRTLTVVDENLNSEELKRVTVTTNWNEMGIARSLTSVILLSRPPEALPGSIFGIVHRKGDTTNIIKNVTITVTKVGGTDSQNTISRASLDAEGHNYNFAETGTGNYILDAGSWTLTAKHSDSDYLDYVHPTEVIVPDGGPPAEVNIEMEPSPDDAYVRFRIVDMDTGNLVPSFSGGYVRLWEGNGNGYLIDLSIANNRTGTFTVEFGDPSGTNYRDPICMTLATEYAFRQGYAFPTNSMGGARCLYNYNYHGWSSAWVDDAGAITNCNNQHYKDPANDRICVHPGDDITVDIPLRRIPLVTISGQIQGHDTSSGASNPRVYVHWARGLSGAEYIRWPFYQYTEANKATGNFQFQVPAVQEIWSADSSNSYNNYLLVRPYTPNAYEACCENSTRTWDWYEGATDAVDWRQVGPLWAGDSPRDTGIYTMPVLTDTTCGNAQGNIVDAKTGGAIGTVNVNIRDTNDATDASGNYAHVCSGAGYRLDSSGGRQRVRTSDIGANLYYDMDTNGNNYYSSKWGIDLIDDATATWDGKLWPIGKGDLRVTVLDKSSSLPVDGATVVLSTHDGGSATKITDATGVATFTQVIETWPPVAMDPSDAYFNHTVRNHTVQVTSVSSGNFEIPVSGTVSNLNIGETVDVTLELIPDGAL